MEREAEYVVVGSGAGGGPLACRLAEAGHSVLLLEAGGGDAPANVEVPAFHPFAAEDPAIAWAFYVDHYDDPERQARDPKHQPGRGILYPRAGTLGGCTAHNALLTVYPHDADWNRIADAVGDRSWSAPEMRRWFRQLEHCDHAGGLLDRLLAGLRRLLRRRSPRSGHGFDGWLHTQQSSPLLIAKDVELLGVALRAVGIAFEEERGGTFERALSEFDPNEDGIPDDAEGYVLVPLATDRGRRNGPRELIAATRESSGGRLQVLTHALATRVVLEDGGDRSRATGVEFLQGERLYRADPNPSAAEGTAGLARATREVIVCGGAFNSPQLLKLSGIGPREELERHGIAVRVDLPGVGRNLQDRYEVPVIHQMTKDFVLTKDLRFRAPTDGERPEKAWTEWLAGEGPYASNGVVGAVIKRSRDDLPVADLFMFGAPAEFRGYYPGYSHDAFAKRDRFTWAVLKAHTQNQGGEVLLRSSDPRDTPLIRFHYFDEGTDRAGEDLDAVVEGVRFVRRLMREWQVPDGELVPGADVATHEQLRTFVRDQAWGHHASCTCPMGADDDPNAVLDNRLRVRGVDGLRVVDASAFPRIPGFFIVTAVYMLSEKGAAMVLADREG